MHWHMQVACPFFQVRLFARALKFHGLRSRCGAGVARAHQVGKWRPRLELGREPKSSPRRPLTSSERGSWRIIVRRESLPHNRSGQTNYMQKLLIVGLLALAAIAVLTAQISTTYARHAAAAGRVLPASNSAAAHARQDAGSDDDPALVLRFASNPSPMPPFLVNDLDGNVISTASWRGKVVLVNFWATWCPPCRDEIPEMIELANRYKDRLQIIGISQDDDAPPEEVRAFAAQMGINYPVVMGSNALSAEYGGVPALPTSFVVNPDGRVVQKHVGLYPIEVYENEIRSLLGMHVDAKVETFEDAGQIFLKNAANATELPGVDFKGLSAEQKRAALKRLNSESCTCGCKLTIAQCRINDSSCSTSQGLAQKIVREIRSAHPGSPASSTIAR
jgi:thiol-disulfide isomerase/thioredoxin